MNAHLFTFGLFPFFFPIKKIVFCTFSLVRFVLQNIFMSCLYLCSIPCIWAAQCVWRTGATTFSGEKKVSSAGFSDAFVRRSRKQSLHLAAPVGDGYFSLSFLLLLLVFFFIYFFLFSICIGRARQGIIGPLHIQVIEDTLCVK
jgi:hypothetical protein